MFGSSQRNQTVFHFGINHAGSRKVNTPFKNRVASGQVLGTGSQSCYIHSGLGLFK